MAAVLRSTVSLVVDGPLREPELGSVIGTSAWDAMMAPQCGWLREAVVSGVSLLQGLMWRSKCREKDTTRGKWQKLNLLSWRTK